ncbi:hypothetical protein A1O1_07711 [Capronia coronata CBS 617.96]|uniref:DUF2293 domain-containing protein n=1 Tax=Capronia coronata CBS 617.96 TaxID=1182541 RepID=W9XXD2_9EURO|nr:uncharacterized protein A1O1_07711 [Capronia coronata CBS 617.96]EXJ81646.1 hypothetical protein A1O1_07711 [Capronia coronata CBS 617.96]
MARVKQKAGKIGGGGASTRGGQAAKQRNKHKVVVEETSKQNHKLRSMVTFRPDPPPGYTFIPAGNPELTAALKEFARRGDNKIYAVTTTPHADRHELSREVHRVGFHFPTNVVAQVCAHYGIRLTSGGKVIDESKDDKLFMQVYQNGQRPVEQEEEAEEKDQITINTEAKQTIKDLFPNIPDKDLFQIIKTAFQKGDNKVGTADEIPLVRRAQLSVVAHIRHMYTQYDKLLRRVPYNDARHMVEQDTLKKLIEWRADEDTTDEATKRAADDLLREVIVISDEEDSDAGSDDLQEIRHDNVHVEELPSAAYAQGLGRPRSPLSQPSRGDVNHEYPYLPRVVHRYKPTDDEIAERDRSRYAVWNQAKRDYRPRMPQEPVTVLNRIYEPEPPTSRVLIPLDPPAHPTRSQHPPVTTARAAYEPHPVRHASPPTFIRGADGTLYERVSTRSNDIMPDRATRHEERAPPTMLPPPTRVRTRPSSPQGYPYRDQRLAGNPEVGDATVLPSIEGPDGAYMSPRSRQNPFDNRMEPHETNLAREDNRNIRDVAYIDLTGSGDQSSKRRRFAEVPPLPEYRTARRDSPNRHREHHYVQQSQPGVSRAETRVFDYGELRSSPRLRHQDSALEPLRHVERPSVYDIRDPLPAKATTHQTSLAVNGRHEMAASQSRYHSQNHLFRRSDGLEISTPRNGGQYFPNPGQRVYEPILDSPSYENQNALERNGAIREQQGGPIPRDSRPWYTYPSGSMVTEQLGELPRQRVLEYDFRPAATAGHYAQVNR